MAEKSVALYELVAEAAEAAGVPVLRKMPTSAKKGVKPLKHSKGGSCPKVLDPGVPTLS